MPGTAEPVPSGNAISQANVVNGIASAMHGFTVPQATSAEVFISEALALMDGHARKLHCARNALIAIVETAARQALGMNFDRLVLVGSTALCIETPGSDLDIVCFTRDLMGAMSVDHLRNIHWALQELIHSWGEQESLLRLGLIDDARVPILQVWCPGADLAMDISVDQTLPVDHVRWFRENGAAPRLDPPPLVAPPITLVLRCVKWWLRHRRIPRMKEGGFPTIVWLLMALHAVRCSVSLPFDAVSRPMATLLVALHAFFEKYSTWKGLHGAIVFSPDGSEFHPHKETHAAPWVEFSVMDPTRQGAESLDLAPRIAPATMLLLVHEIRRAARRLPSLQETNYGDGRQALEEIFTEVPETQNQLPVCLSDSTEAYGVMILYGEGVGRVEVGLVNSIIPRAGWTAPFLHRRDDRSSVQVHLLDAEDRTTRFHSRRKPPVVICPCQFICRVIMWWDTQSKAWAVTPDSWERYQEIKRSHAEIRHRQNRCEDMHKAEVGKEIARDIATAVAAISSPGRSRKGETNARC
jgi:hypothetical protein